MTRRQYSMAYLTQNSNYFKGVTSVKQPFRRAELDQMPAEATEFAAIEVKNPAGIEGWRLSISIDGDSQDRVQTDQLGTG